MTEPRPVGTGIGLSASPIVLPCPGTRAAFRARFVLASAPVTFPHIAKSRI